MNSKFFIRIIIIKIPLLLFTAGMTEIHREPLWPKGKKIFMPDCNNPFKSIVGLLERNPTPIRDPSSEVTYYLYPKTDTGSPIKVDLRNLGDLLKYVEPEGLWLFGIHGFDGDYTAGPIFRSTAKDIHATRVSNIVQVDWKRLAAAPFYLTAKDNTKVVGMHIASMISQLVLKSLAQPEKIQLVGFSLGAHAAGYAGKTLAEKYKLKEHRITGLDPTGPGFDRESKSNKLDPSDGRYVEVIHTNVGFLGTVNPSGHVDYYVNGGKPIQPKCPWVESLTLYSCSHQYALKVFNGTIGGSYLVHKCSDSKSAMAGSCSSGFTCSVGFVLPNCPSGVYYLATT